MGNEPGDTPEAARMKDLLARLVSFASENPPGREAEMALYLGDAMQMTGFDVQTPEVAPGRRSAAASFDNGNGPTLAFIPIWTRCRPAAAGPAIHSA